MTKNTASIQATYVHWLTNICSLAHEHMFIGSRTYVLRNMLVLVMMMIGANVWGQGQTHPYAGVWFMNVQKNPNYYMVPAADPKETSEKHVNEDAYFSSDYSTQAGDPEKPFITTYQTSGDLNSIWIFVPVSGENNFYYIVHAKTGKYVKYQQYLSGGNARRKFVHLETMVTPGETEKFEITALSEGVKIKPKNNTMYFNVAGDNQPRYNGGTTNPYYSGMVGGMDGTDTNSQFNLTDASSLTLLTPVISDLNEETNTFTITSPAAAFSSFRYTTDGSTTPTASVGTPSGGTSIFPTAIWQVQAVGVFDNFVTPVAGPKTITPIIPVIPTITYNNTTGEVTISSTDGTTIYYTASTSGSEPDDPTSSSYDGTGASPITISGVTTPTIYKAIATKSGFEDSEVATQSIEKLGSPSLNFVDATKKVSVTTNSEVAGATSVYTTDGNDPTPSSTEYSEPISLTGTTTVKAMNVLDGYINSDVASLTVTKLASSPTISISGSTVTLSYSDPGATIYYMTDGTTPTQGSSHYSAPFSLDGNQKYTIKAIATKTGYLNSNVVVQVVDNRSSIPAPTITYTGNAVTITANDVGDEIYYTTDGSTPTTSTTTHFTSSGTFNLVNGSNYIIKAIASNGNTNSLEATENIDLTNIGYSGIYYFQNNADGTYYMYPVGGESTLVKTAKKTDEDAIWEIEIVGNYYRIIHYKDGKYLVAKDLVEGSMPDTETVSLVATDNPGENSLFEISRKSGDESDIMQQIILIRPKAATNETNEDGHIYLNTRGGNNGTNLIGLYDNTGSSEWKLATVPAKPTFTVNDINVTISSDLGNVYYTIDGTTPTSSSSSGKKLTLKYGPSYTVKAICIYHDDISGADWTSDVAISNSIQVNLLNPIIARSGNNVTISNSQASGVTFRYTFSDNGTDPANPVSGGAGTDYTSALPLTANARNVFKAIAYNTVDGITYTSDVVTFVVDLRSATTISSLADITSATGSYKLASGFSATGTPQEGGVEIGTSTNPFRGTIDGNLVEFELSSPLFDYVQDATIKNVIISKATISTSGNAGAIANNALGATHIYNCGVLATGSTVEKDDDGYDHISSCSSTISGSGYVGGIVGLLDGSSRVINCFSYANITGGSNVGGIVGWNNVATTSANLATMVMNCMFYGDITGGTSKAPIYNGQIITNDGDADGVNNFNYFWAGASYVQEQKIDNARYNCALSAETRFLQRFEFFRSLLNSNRELAAWWATGDVDNKDEMMKWVLEPSQIGTATPYPILKAPDRYPSVVNIDVNHSDTYKGRDMTVGPKLSKTLSVTIRNSTTDAVYGAPTGANITTTSLSLNIMDKDPDHFNFNYYKVQLPYYNDVGTGNYTGNRVVTGWKIVTISGGTTVYSTDNDNNATTPADAEATISSTGDITLDKTPYNFADRNCTDKDKYGVSGRVFNQGAYWDVPEGVTAITIEPYWGKAVYLSDAYWDVTYKNNGNDAMATAANVPNVGGGQRYENGKKYNLATQSIDETNGQIVYTSMSNAIASSGSALYSGVTEAARNGHSVYDYAVVLVGNYHFNGTPEASNSKPYTVTSIDMDGDNEPDYSYILRFNGRLRVHPVRIDFLTAIGLGMAQKTTGSTGTYNFGIMQPKGWFESTNTATFRMTQFEYDYAGRVESPMILQGGVIEQWVTVGGKEESIKEGKTVTYYHVGGNVWFKEFHIGVHQDKIQNEFVSPHPPISVTGGDFNEFYLTGLYNTPNKNSDDNAECYINGGRFGKVAGTGMQGIGGFTMTDNVKTAYSNGNIIWQIDNADIDEFYAGGINAAHIAEGNIYTVISNSRVDQFCGGPKFGDMNSDKKVVTNATNCTFRTFFGAGYGGNSYNRRYPDNQNNVTNINWDTWVQGNNGLKYRYDSDYGGVETRIDYQFIPMSNNTGNVARLFVDYVSFSLATTHDVTSKLTGCTITTSPLGRLDLFDQCLGNFYGGGSLGKVTGNVKSTLTNCTVEGNVFGGGYSATLPTVKVMKNTFKTQPRYDQNLGAYLEAELPETDAEYTWEHRDEVNSTATAIDKTNHILYTTEDLTGLGAVTGNVTLTIDGNTTLTDGKKMSVTKSVYGGGEESNVEGNTQVNINGGTITQNVFGGGKGEADEFSCSKAMIGVNNTGAGADLTTDENKNKGTKVTISNGQVNGNVYGGGEVGRVEWNTQVKIGVGTGNGPFAPVINGSVFGAGKGEKTHGYAALVRGNSTVTIQGNAKVRENVYGGGEQATVGRYWVKGINNVDSEGHPISGAPPAPTDMPDEMPYKTMSGGQCTVTIQGSAQIGPESGAASETTGHVFGAGKGVTPNYVHTGATTNWSRRMVTYNSEKHISGEGGNEGQTWDYYVDDKGKKDTRYVWEYFVDDADPAAADYKTGEAKYLEFLQTLALVTGTEVTIGGDGVVKGNVYGGSESGFVQDDTRVTIKGSNCEIGTTTYGNVFGGGRGLDTFAEAGKVKGTTTVAIEAGAVKGNVYGGGELGDVGLIDKTDKKDGQLTYNYFWKQTDGSTANVAEYNKNATATNTGICNVTISGGTIGTSGTVSAEHGNVYGAGRGTGITWWCEKAIAYATNVTITDGTVNGNVYGGGQIDRVEDDAKVTIGTPNETGESKPTIIGSVYGAGAGLATHGYSALVRGNAEVTVQGTAQIGGSVYGGGETASVGKFEVVGGLPTKPKTGGTCIVNIKDNAKIGESGTGHNVYGACKGVTPAYNNTEGDPNRSKSMQLKENKPSDASLWSHYNNDENSPFIWRYYATEADYLAFLKTLALTSHPHVTIGGTWTPNGTTGTITASGTPTVYGSVYGGGQRGVTLGHVDVNMVGGTVEQDVYGGGALADTNLGNWDVNGYVEATALNEGESITDLYERSGAGTAENPYKYTKITDSGTTFSSGTYYRQEATWAHTEGSAFYTTSVDLTGGLIKGDAYGGGLGQLGDNPVEAVVWGDINVALGGTFTGSTTVPSSSATGFYITNYTDDHSDVIKSGRIFGCNNLNGSPQGDVRVTVWKTVKGNTEKTAEVNLKDANATHSYNVAAVYGGGNLANYAPAATGKKAYVRIETCDVSIESVYGGGNAAEAPETNVLVRGAYEINEVFGGGNGKDPYTLNGTEWIPNSGADVRGNATTLLTGGLVHGAYGGSNKRGTIYGNVNIDTGTGSETDNSTNAGCSLDVEKLVGAGKDADVNGDLIMVMGCKPNEKIPVVYAGADNANVNGDVMLTITSGKFGKVFGGNNAGGYILGRIRLNIEETADCDPAVPIEIDELYLGGNEAEYSMYGYYNAGTADAPVYKSRTAAMAAITDPSAQGYTPAVTTMAGMEVRKTAPYAKPELNIISCTRIDKVYGGGYGTGATLYGDPIVNINMIPGQHTSSVSAKMTELDLPSSDNSDKLGIIGDVFGGGNAAKIEGSTTVNIGTATTVNLTSIPDDDTTANVDESLANVKGAYIKGNVYGGGNEADVTGNTFVNICAKEETNGSYTSVAFGESASGVTIGGDVFGGGKGKADTFTCEKAMIGTNDAGLNADYADGNTNVVIGNGTINGTVYGGGQIGRVERNTTVTIGIGDGTATGPLTSAPEIKGNVFGAGAGEEEHGYAALVRGNPTVTIQGNAKIGKSVYGGGEIASVARYRVAQDATEAAEHGVEVGMPYVLQNNAYGHCVVTIGGYAEIGPDNMKMYHSEKTDGTDKPDDYGHVFGAGRGVLPKVYTSYGEAENGPRRMVLAADKTTSIWEYFVDEEKYFEFIRTLALATETQVTIGDHAFVKGSVYGGSENGIVQYDTNVTIKDHCQIGQGKEITMRYEDYTGGDLFELTTPPVKSGSGSETVYYDLECASWDYGLDTNADGKKDLFAPYDPNANATGDLDKYPAVGTATAKSTEGGRRIATDGHTYYGNVFGGGSGSVPYFDTTKGVSRYIMSAGWVKGNTNVTISGGHILTNVYGGNEATNVDGTATITMTGGTIGVPRTLQQIADHPLTCYLFGAGKGDQRAFFNKDTNVKDVVLNLTGGRIYGSVFGGGEDGHVLRDVTMTIGQQTTTGEGNEAVTTTSGPTIGTWGTSYVDGNVFGGGRGFGGDAYTAGNVAGSVTMQILGGTMLGSIYGGGRLGSVGYGLFDATESGYGEMRADDAWEEGFSSAGYFTHGRGHIDITISGGTIGNDHEYKVPNASNIPNTITEQDISKWTTTTGGDWDKWKAHNHIPKTEFDTATGRLTHTKGGNVFAGGMGRFYQLDGTTPISVIDWWKLGNVKSTKLTITGGTIKSNVYGGGELGQVVEHHTTQNANFGTEITIQGSSTQIGTEVKNGETTEYTFGSVFGGGYGSLLDDLTVNGETTHPKFDAGLVKEDTKIDMQGGVVKASIYGGGEMASVGESTTSGETTTVTGSTYVSVSGGTVGIAPITVSGTTRYFGGAKMGNVYGGGSGHNNTVRSGRILKNTNVTISDGTIYHNVYGGGAYGTVGDFEYQTGSDYEGGPVKVQGINGLATTGTGVANVTIIGGTIGYDGNENGMVFGSSRGDINEPGKRDDHCAWVYDTNVIIGTEGSETGPQIKGTVYGSGENGHTYNNTVVTVNSGTIGIAEGSPIGTYTEGGAAYPYRGNVYGGGCGTDTYPVTVTEGEGQSAVTIQAFNPLAGIVYGNTTVNINGGKVVRNVYGAGAMGSVGKTTWTTTSTTTGDVTTTTKSATTSGGSTTININGGIIGVSGTVGDGNLFGAARGSKAVVQADQDDIARVSVTNVNVSGGLVKGNVYGGGELGDVGTIVKNTTDYNYTWEKSDGGSNVARNNKITGTNTNTGICNVTITGGTIGSTTVGTGNVFGGGKGDANTWWCEKAMAFAANVSISKGSNATAAPVVYGTVYGGGEVGRVEDDTKVIIGTANGSDEPDIKGNVFGAGKGMATRGYSALVRGNSIVTIQGNAKVGGNVFGGGEEASLGRFVLDKGLPKSPASGGSSEVTIQDNAKIGSSGTGNHVYGAGQGVNPAFDSSNYKNFKSMQLDVNKGTGAQGTDWDYYVDDDGNKDRRFVWVYYKTEPEYQAFLNTLALASHPTVTIAENATIYGDVYGGGQRGITLGNVAVNITGGTVKKDVYGGGSLADTNKGNWDDSQYVPVTLSVGHTLTDLYTKTGDTYIAVASDATATSGTTYYSKGTWATGKYDGKATTYKTNVALTGGTIEGNVYGGGLGQIARAASAAQGTEGQEGYVPAVTKLDEVKAKVYGDVLVTLNKPTTSGETTTYGNCVVKENIFGCNNQNGSPQSAVTVHVYKTEGWTGHEGTSSDKLDSEEASDHSYHLNGVYGGGNLSAFYPDLKETRDTVQAFVIIDGCDQTSIKQVYGGGNAASIPATNITINASYEIEEVFGGGNGLNEIIIHDQTMTNPGANVGYEAYPISYDIPESSKEERTAKFSYGSGKSSVTIYDGLIHRVFGGSNKKGNVRESAVTLLDDQNGCHFQVDEAYGGGKNAPMDAEAKLLMACIPGLKVAYGGAQEADVLGGVTLTITNGTYERVFGGNNISGTIQGPIVVNIEETGCRPIIIGELYGGGNRAAYSVYGYKMVNGELKPRESSSDGDAIAGTPYADPVVNVKSFTSIGTIYGGGYGETAVMVGNPTVNIDVFKGQYANDEDNVINENAKVVGSTVKYSGDGYDTGFPVPSHAKGAIGAIGTVFGGGNAAKVIGTPTVNIGTRVGEQIDLLSVPVEDSNGKTSSEAGWIPTYQKETVLGADIRGDIYGAGNNAEVTGDTKVQIGKKIETSTTPDPDPTPGP